MAALNLAGRLDRLEAAMGGDDDGREPTVVILPINGRDPETEGMPDGTIMVQTFPPGSCEYITPDDPRYAEYLPAAGDDWPEYLGDPADGDAVLERYVRAREAGGPDFEPIDLMEQLATSAGFSSVAEMEHEQEWEAAMRAGFPRPWRHVRRPDGRWSYQWA